MSPMALPSKQAPNSGDLPPTRGVLGIQVCAGVQPAGGSIKFPVR